MKNINVLIVIQGEEILNLIEDKVLQPGTFGAPVDIKDLAEGSVFAISEGNSDINVASNDAKIGICAEVGDVITFSIDTQSKGQMATPFFYKPKQKGPTPDLELFIFELQNEVYLPPSEDPLAEPSKYLNNYSRARGFVTRTNDILANTLMFGVMDNSSGKAVGYFRWDLSLEVQH